MKKAFIIIISVLSLFLTSFSEKEVEKDVVVKEPTFSFNEYANELYGCVNDAQINSQAFNIALKGYYNLLSNNLLENK